MQVWILEKGEYGEAGRVLGVFNERHLARNRMHLESLEMAFGAVVEPRDLPGDVTVLDDGYDWLAVRPHDVVEIA